jgi:hypothetical protein
MSMVTRQMAALCSSSGRLCCLPLECPQWAPPNSPSESGRGRCACRAPRGSVRPPCAAPPAKGLREGPCLQ